MSDMLDQALAQIDKMYGKGSVMRPGAGAADDKIDVIPTGVMTVDLALGVGGIPRGRIIELYGNESAGKSTLSLHAVASAQRMGLTVAYIDVEHALDLGYAANLGVDLDSLILSQPDYGEQALEIVDMLIRSGEVGLVVVDSVAQLIPKAELEGEIEKQHMGLQARLMAKGMRKLTAVAAQANTAIIFINQIREKVGITFGSPEVTPGGRALKFAASIRMELRKGDTIKAGENVIAVQCKVKIVKNKVASPYKQTTFDIFFGEGADMEGALIDAGVQLGLINRTGAWITWGETKWHGRDDARMSLRGDTNTQEMLKREVLEAAN